MFDVPTNAVLFLASERRRYYPKYVSYFPATYLIK